MENKNDAVSCERIIHHASSMTRSRLRNSFLTVVQIWCVIMYIATGFRSSSMSLTSQDIARIANLARLELSPDESARLQVQTNDFFNIVEKMRAVDTTGIDPLAHPLDTIQAMSLRLRDDVASEPNNREANQKTAPAVEKGLFLVPKVIE